jgi:hypothetical protein
MRVLSHQMRTRIRSQPQDHAGRRRSAARRPPDQELVLRLQRTIGNRATTQLLRQPTATEEEVLADVAQERARYDAAKRIHQQRLAEHDARSKPHALKTAGITTDSRVNEDTPKWIQAALAESRLLRPYLKGKFPGQAVTDKFRLHTNEDDFNIAAKAHLGNKDNMTESQRAAAFGDIGGFYERKTNEVHVRSRTKFGHALHEAMHKVAHPVFHPYWQRFINEGVTQYFTDMLLEEQGLSKVTDHKYQAELACAKKLATTVTTWQVVAAAYFQNDGALRETLMRRFHLDAGAMTQAIGAEQICSRL